MRKPSKEERAKIQRGTASAETSGATSTEPAFAQKTLAASSRAMGFRVSFTAKTRSKTMKSFIFTLVWKANRGRNRDRPLHTDFCLEKPRRHESSHDRGVSGIELVSSINMSAWSRRADRTSTISARDCARARHRLVKATLRPPQPIPRSKRLAATDWFVAAGCNRRRRGRETDPG